MEALNFELKTHKLTDDTCIPLPPGTVALKKSVSQLPILAVCTAKFAVVEVTRKYFRGFREYRSCF